MIQVGSIEYKRWSKWRQWQYRKKLKRLGLYKPTPPQKPLPGSAKQRRYAKNVLLCKRVDDETWEVWGGQAIHVIKEFQTENGTGYRCDCDLFTKEKRVCSHILKIIFQEQEEA